ncbi:putative bacitracin transport ATP-binding BcrA domain protein [Carnobacterium maltaromaticum LMA28]|uniref:Bacitracin transport ATP-binding BcrA domain protein n=1 Tax=Carnobacterium maltaromaticum LMA28 TaxID=1234679 RepID=K8EWE1_CARML|nr:putative bacitracin transport ATP-binding BcrA domain protein [Carnobacterium maltaromaticum LMA28]
MKLILLDEPSNGLDLDSQKELEAIIQSIGKKEETQIVISSHDINLLSDICNQYIYIREGKLIKSIENKKSNSQLIDMYNNYLKEGEI